MKRIEKIIQNIMSNDFSSLPKEERMKIEFEAISLFGDSSENTDSDLSCMIYNLNRNKQGGAYAPHKPVLLLSIIELIEDGVITTNKIELNDRLRQKFNVMWTRSVPQRCKFKCDIRAPFTYLSNEPFWTLSENKKEAIIDRDMFDSFFNEMMRAKIKNILCDMAQNQSVPQYTDNFGMVAEKLIMMFPATSSLIALYA